MNTVNTAPSVTSPVVVGAGQAASSVLGNGGSKIPIVSEVATAPSLATSSSQSLESMKQEVSVLQDRIAEAEIGMKAAQTAKVLSIPTYLGVEDLEEVLDLLKAQMREKLKRSRSNEGKPTIDPSPAPRVHGKGHHLPQSTIAQMCKMLGARETAACIATTLGVGLSTVESYKARWGLTRHHHKGKVPGLNGKAGSSSNRISPEKRNEIISAFNADHVTVTDLARRFGVSRQSLYTIRRAVKRRQTVAA